MVIIPVLLGRLKENGTQSIKIRLTHNRKTVYIDTHLSIEPKFFNTKTGQVLFSAKEYSEYNAKLNEILNNYNVVLTSMGDLGRFSEVSRIKDYLIKFCKSNRKITNSDNFISVAQSVIDRMKEEDRKGSAECIQSAVSQLKKYTESDSLFFSEITPQFLWLFKQWFVKNVGKEITYNKHLRSIKIIFNHAIKNKMIDRSVYPFDAVSITNNYDVEIKCLEVEDINNMLLYDNIGVDMFMLSFYLCGMNLKDIVSIPKPKDGYIEVKRAKTIRSSKNVKLRLKIQPEAQSIINKYSDDQYMIKTIYKDYRCLNAKINFNLKLIAQQIGVNHVSFTYARHSWATIAGESGVTDEIIDRALMHSVSGKMIEKYRRFDYSKIDNANRLVIDKIWQK